MSDRFARIRQERWNAVMDNSSWETNDQRRGIGWDVGTNEDELDETPDDLPDLIDLNDNDEDDQEDDMRGNADEQLRRRAFEDLIDVISVFVILMATLKGVKIDDE